MEGAISQMIHGAGELRLRGLWRELFHKVPLAGASPLEEPPTEAKGPLIPETPEGARSYSAEETEGIGLALGVSPQSSQVVLLGDSSKV